MEGEQGGSGESQKLREGRLLASFYLEAKLGKIKMPIGCKCVCTCVCGGQRSPSSVIPHTVHLDLLRWGLPLVWNSPIQLSQLPAPEGPFCLRLPNAGILSVPYCVQLLNASSGNQTQVFVFARQALTNRAILPAHGGPPCYTVQD